jgi:hypothetical protein
MMTAPGEASRNAQNMINGALVDMTDVVYLTVMEMLHTKKKKSKGKWSFVDDATCDAPPASKQTKRHRRR